MKPIAFYYVVAFLLTCTECDIAAFTIVLNPYGDAGQVGRIIDDAYERSIAFQFVHALKRALEKLAPEAWVVISHSPCQKVQAFQHAQFANHISPELFLHVGVYRELCPRPRIELYQFLYEPVYATPPAHAWLRADYAHARSHSIITGYLERLVSFFSEHQPQQAIVTWHQLPYKPLKGVQVPAFGIELGIESVHEWESMVQPIAHGLVCLMKGS